MQEVLRQKYDDLLEILRSYKSVVVAFSSGVDSTLLLYAAKEALGKNMLAVTASTPSIPQRELTQAYEYCKRIDVEHVVLELDQLSIPGFKENPSDKCYICKKAIFQSFVNLCREKNFCEVVEGSNLDDQGDYRPGLKAIAELGIRSPLKEVGLSKADIREISQSLGLPTYNKPSYACLASRFPYGELITKEKLALVDKGEQLLFDMGFKQFRVRIHGNKNYIARIELLPEEFERILSPEIRDKVNAAFKDFGFAYTSLDLRGYRTGSMNETL